MSHLKYVLFVLPVVLALGSCKTSSEDVNGSASMKSTEYGNKYAKSVPLKPDEVQIIKKIRGDYNIKPRVGYGFNCDQFDDKSKCARTITKLSVMKEGNGSVYLCSVYDSSSHARPLKSDICELVNEIFESYGVPVYERKADNSHSYKADAVMTECPDQEESWTLEYLP